METNQPIKHFRPDSKAVEDHIVFYENKAENELHMGKFLDAAQSYAAAAKICQSLEDLENAQTLFSKSSETFRNIDPAQAHRMFKQASDLSLITGIDIAQQQQKSSSSEEDEEDEEEFDRGCHSIKKMVVTRLKSCFD